MIFAIILLALLGLSVLVNFSQFAGSIMHVSRGARDRPRARDTGPRLDEAVIEDNQRLQQNCGCGSGWNHHQLRHRPNKV